MNRPLPPLPPHLAARLAALAGDAGLAGDALAAVTLLINSSLLEPVDEPEIESPRELTRTQPDLGADAEDLFGPPGERVRPNLGRYEELGLLGRGGAGEVWRAYDAHLNRTVALKVLRGPHSRDPVTLSRFRAEARVAAALAHPCVVTVYESGELPDGRPYYTMEEVRGHTLRELISSSHQGAAGVTDGALRRLVQALRDAAQAVAYAHSKGVIHRDLKPSNIMVEGGGGVRILDWGLFRYLDVPEPDPDERDEPLPEGAARAARRDPGATRADDGGDGDPRRGEHNTREGAAGTPPYMAPEQLRGVRLQQGPWTDLYALGAILFEILTGFPPVRASSMSEVARQLDSGWREPMVARHAIPEPLRQLCERALVGAPDQRLADAGVMADHLDTWLVSSEDEGRGQQLLAEADRALEEVARSRARAASLRFASDQALRELYSLEDHDAVEVLQGALALQDEADRLDHERAARMETVSARLQGSLTRDPNLTGLHERLAEVYRTRLAEAEARGQPDPQLLAQLIRYDQGRHAEWIQGEGSLTLCTDPPGALVTIFQLERLDLRLQPVHARALGPTPLVRLPLGMGSWLLCITCPGRSELQVPVHVGRGEHVNIGGGTTPLGLPPLGALGPLDRLVAAGPCWIGGDPLAPNSHSRRRVTVPSFVLRARPLSEADLDPAGDPDLPAHGLSFEEARAVAARMAERDGLPWRLPTELEWEKAARAGDGRTWPWGSQFDPSFAVTAAAGLAGPAPMSASPLDRSPYGVEGMAGNVADWCTTESGAPVARGGMWAAPPNAARCAARHRLHDPLGGIMVGVRLARSWC